MRCVLGDRAPCRAAEEAVGYVLPLAINVHHSEHEGGMNLSMPRDAVMNLARRGGMAAERFKDFTFDSHRWVRFRTAMSEIEQSLTGMRASYTTDLPNGACHRDFIETYGPNATHYKGPAAWRLFAQNTTQALMDIAAEMESSPERFSKNAPKPDPDLRVVPRY